MKHFIYLVLALLSFQFVCAQNTSRKYLSHIEENGTVQVRVNDGTYVFQFYSEDMIQATFIPKDQTESKASHAVVLEPKRVDTNYSYEGNVITYSSKGISVAITTEPFKISYQYDGEELISERRGYFKSKHEPMEMVSGNIVVDNTEKIEFNLTEDEILYGGGARALGMNRRGHRLPLFNRAHYGYETESKLMNYTMPIVISSKQYMIHFDNAPIGYLDFDSKKENTLTYETISGRKTYQVIAGESWYDVVENYTKLTGKQPMLPRWALGNFSSRFGYHSQSETIETIDKFKADEIPVDAVILDLYWFGKDIKGTMGNLEFLKDSFPNPQQMIKTLKSKNVETILITEPFVLTTSNRWDEAVREDILAKDSIGNPATYDFYFGNTGIIDIYSNSGKTWFKNIYKELSKLGVNGFWGDLGEPEVHPNWVQHAKGSADEVHNIYGHDWAKLVYESSLEANPNKRPFILMRAGYSGSQRYGMVPWSGDVNRTWGGLQSQPEIALQMGMQGLGYMHSDLGGFAGANLNDELYTRWLQYGVFQPIYRPHAQEEVASEPVFRSDKAKALAKEAIELRYRMLPYNYHLMALNHLEGKPLMRPLFFEDDSKILKDDATAYFWGHDFLVSPITISQLKHKTVYFPKSSDWFDFYSDKKHKGGSVIVYDLKENSIPTFVRAGAFIPLAKPVQSTADYDGSKLEIHYYFDKSITESEREFYNDDGTTFNALEKEQYEILEFEAEMKGRWLEIEFEADTGANYQTNIKTIELVVHNIQNTPKRIKVDGKRLNSHTDNTSDFISIKDKTSLNWNFEKKMLTIPILWNTSKDKKIRVKLKK
ncbi:TIM-barrel domain-containing protein [uncultured Psychroserpens sp.]|uniref:glycoside hydrolase family 31 protein n=1 Tax=uncultured Psychroserpens sp. TaxID=255436 RepID=UPI00262C1272|nr:TIM-barrel domain-containing protein [uncultured Psychroserpens sp.]